MSLPSCPKCNASYTYEDGHLFVCPMCFHEWTAERQRAAEESSIIHDANGNELNTGDDVTLIRDLKLGKDTLKRAQKPGTSVFWTRRLMAMISTAGSMALV